MYIEIEAKLKVDSLEEIAARLSNLGAEFCHRAVQTDCFFDDAQNSLTSADKCLRLRRELIDDEERIFLTFKGSREKSRLKKRQEIQIQLQDADAAEQLFGALAFERRLVFQKKRQLWRFADCAIALDELPLLGEFVEIEGPEEKKIADVQKKLDLAHLPHISDSYAFMMRRQLARSGPQKQEVLF